MTYPLLTTPYKLLVIVGPTASGKSELAMRLAKKFNGEIISCDSLQIYRRLNLGTGKVTGKWVQFSPSAKEEWPRLVRRSFSEVGSGRGGKLFVYKSIPHHLIDFVNPRRQYSAALFQREAKKVIADVWRRGKLPILCGGTAQWIDAVVFNQRIPDVKPNLKLRMKLEKKSADDLYRKLKKLDPRRAANIDRHNKRRLIRALEIIIATGKPVPPRPLVPSLPLYSPLWIGVKVPQPVLFSKIKTRLSQRLKAGMIAEVKRLHQYSPLQNMERVPHRGGRGLSWKRLESFGLEYKFVALYLQKKISYDEMFNQLLNAIRQYSKRQMTWWKRNKNIKWIQKASEAEKSIKKFI